MSEKAPSLPVELNENYQELHAMVAKDGSRRVYGVDEDGGKHALKGDDVLAAYGYEPTDVTKLDPTEGGPVVVDPEPITPIVKGPEGHKHDGGKKEYTMRAGNSTFRGHEHAADRAVAARKSEVVAQDEEVRRFELMGEVKNSPDVQRLNDTAQLQIYGSGDREWVNPATGQTLPPIKGRLQEIREDRSNGGMAEAVREARADAYQASIDELLESGLELCQAKLIMDLREKDKVKVVELAGKFNLEGASPDEAHRKASELYDKADKKRLDIIRKGGVFTMRDYAHVLRGADLYVPRQPEATDVDAEEPVEAIVVDDEPGAEVPTRVGFWGRARNAWNAGRVGLAGLLTGNRRERETDEEGMSRNKKRALGILAVGLAVGAGYLLISKGIHAGGGKSSGSSDTVNHALNGRGNGGGNSLVDVAGNPPKGGGEAAHSLIDNFTARQLDNLHRMIDWEQRLIEEQGWDINNPKSWNKANRMFVKGLNYMATRGQGGNLPETM